MKALPWILFLVSLAATGFLFTKNKKSETELARLHQENLELQPMRAAFEEMQRSDPEAKDLGDKEKAELIRLRNEVGQLRREKQQLGTQIQQVQQKSEQLLQSQQAQQAQQLQQLQRQNQQLAQESGEQQIIKARNQCVNNLRQIDGAIQQWALETKQSAESAVTANDVAPYLVNSQLPVCPSAGVYTLTRVDTAPVCSASGHALTP